MQKLPENGFAATQRAPELTMVAMATRRRRRTSVDLGVVTEHGREIEGNENVRLLTLNALECSARSDGGRR